VYLDVGQVWESHPTLLMGCGISSTTWGELEALPLLPAEMAYRPCGERKFSLSHLLSMEKENGPQILLGAAIRAEQVMQE
jgi:hypothetical protein